jgi:hypothetical protein
MYNYQSNPTVMNCIFTGNMAFDGAGMYNFYQSSPTVTDCNFIGNRSESGGGGGMYNFFHSSPMVTNCVFSENIAYEGYGGGMYNRYYSFTTVTNCKFRGNIAGEGGGMCNSEYSRPTVTQCTFNNNTADQDGGGMYNFDSNPTVTNCIFTGNGGSGIYNFESSPTMTNCILWGDIPDEISNISSFPVITYSDIQGGFAGTGNINGDPRFVNAGSGDFHLRPDSPCIDAGSNSAPNLPPTDLAGNPRVVDGDSDDTATIDMGVFEFQPRIHNTTQDTWHALIQRAIDYANDGDEIMVPPGTYYEAIDFKKKAIRLYSSDGPEVTTIDGTGAYHVVYCLLLVSDTILEGFTITGGDANGPSYEDKRGGGMFNDGSYPTVTNCIFIGNSAEYGGGMYNDSGGHSLTVTNCTFTGNSAIYGGGMYNDVSSNPELTNCTFTSNTASEYGGGMYNESIYSTSIMTECIFTGNSAYYGGGMYNIHSSPTVTNCIFSDNRASLCGGGMYNENDSHPRVTNCSFTCNTAHGGGGMFNTVSVINDTGPSNPTVTNCTFSGNQGQYGSGIYNQKSNPMMTSCTFSGNNGHGIYNSESSPTVTNCILWGDRMNEIYNEASTPTVTYCDVQGGTGQYWFGAGCIDSDPCFVDIDNPDPKLRNLRLKLDSPCIDAGDNDSVPADTSDIDNDGNTVEPIPFDIGGLPRFIDEMCTIDTGNPGVAGPPVVDMGAYEFLPADIDGSGSVVLRDLGMLALRWAETGCGRCGGANLNCDGVVDFKDVAILCGNWLAGTVP